MSSERFCDLTFGVGCLCAESMKCRLEMFGTRDAPSRRVVLSVGRPRFLSQLSERTYPTQVSKVSR